jgi:hypothetical protein
MADIKLGVLSRQCLDVGVPDFETLEAQVAACQERPNTAGGRIDWRFITEDARIKLKRLYSLVQD